MSARAYLAGAKNFCIQVLVSWLKIDKEIAAAIYDSLVHACKNNRGIPESDLRLGTEDAKRAGKLNRETLFTDAADRTILREAQKQFGLKRK